VQPYGRHRRIKHNYEDYHPPKGWYNWWEIDCDNINKKATRRKAKQIIHNELIKHEIEEV
jgi:hypothetical protein